MTLHFAPIPHVPGQGSTHFVDIQALVSAHSELIVHSGLHTGGFPKKLGKHEHTACVLTSRH